MLDKIPHYVVGDSYYLNQVEAWKAMESTGQPARFCLYEKAYDQHNWSNDPKESWDELIKIRCLQLRQQYRTLKLLYSGGRDSEHVLRSFAKNNIPIDELLLTHYHLNPIRTQEYQTWIWPMAQRYRQINPQVKITTMTIDADCYKKWYAEDWSEKTGSIAVNGLFQPSDYAWMAEHLGGINDSSTGVVCGVEKPLLVSQGNNVYSTVDDQTFSFFVNSPNLNLEFFYLTPDLPELHIKQCHMMLDYLKTHYPEKPVSFLKDFQNTRITHLYDQRCLSVGRGSAVDINNPAQNGRNKYRGHHPVFKIIAKTIQNSDVATTWHRFVENMSWVQDQIPTAFHDVPDLLHWGTKSIFGKQYFVRSWHNTALDS